MKDWAAFKSFKGGGKAGGHATPTYVKQVVENFRRGFKVVNIAADEPTGTQPDTAYTAGTRSLI